MLRDLCLSAVALASMPVFAGCQTAPQPEQKGDVTADIGAINVLRDQFAPADNSNDAAAVSVFFTDDAVLMFPNQAAIEGKQAIEAALEDFFKQKAAKITHTPLET
jgi:ketosteroid isomerase-like protein